jgi:predicted phosphodiesterase
LTDIHEHVEHLRAALDRFGNERVDQVVVLGDVSLTSERIEETCRLLAEAHAVGVWGNHDFVHCTNRKRRSRLPASAGKFLATLRPRLDLAGCHFTHVEPWLDPECEDDLWYYDGPPDRTGTLERIFAAVPHRVLFSGHYHDWLWARQDGIDGWKGEKPVRLEDGRHFVVVGALCEGQYAVFDTDTSEFVPFNE